ncbi:MAG: L-fuculose-phosphate aldolase [Thiogranum sp.]
MSRELRQQLIDTALQMNHSGINQGTSGNLSGRYGEGLLVTPSGMPYSELSVEDIVYISASGDCEGRRLPSSEWRIHFDIYRSRPDTQAILHAHPTECVALACMHKPIPAFHYMVAVAGGRDIRCAPYATFGSQELSDHVLQALSDRNACLMANHGMVCLGSTPGKALSLAIEVEQLAKSYLRCLAVGDPVLLDNEEMARVLVKFRSYGVQNSGT